MDRISPKSAARANVEFFPMTGSSVGCMDFVAAYLQTRDRPQHVRILSIRAGNRQAQHALLLGRSPDRQIVVPPGFLASGYGGSGPHTFATILALIDSLDLHLDEVDVPNLVWDRLAEGTLLADDLEAILEQTGDGSQWRDYIQPYQTFPLVTNVWQGQYPILPLAVVEKRIFDLAKAFWKDADGAIMTAFRRLEDDVRKASRLTSLDSSRLFSAAFLGEDSALCWNELGAAEQTARGNLFIGAYGTFRNPRAHKEEVEPDTAQQLSEFLLVNLLFALLRQATRRRNLVRTKS